MVKPKKTSLEITIQHTTEINQRCGTHKCVPYAHAGQYPKIQPVVVKIPKRGRTETISAAEIVERNKFGAVKLIEG